MIKARAASLGLVATLGFLLLVSLIISAILSAIGNYIDTVIPFGHVILRVIYLAVSFGLIAVMFAAIYKVSAGLRRQLAGCPARRHRNGRAVHHREVPDQSLYRQQRHRDQLRCGGLDHCVADMAVPIRTHLPARRRIHQGIRIASRQMHWARRPTCKKIMDIGMTAHGGQNHDGRGRLSHNCVPPRDAIQIAGTSPDSPAMAPAWGGTRAA